MPVTKKESAELLTEYERQIVREELERVNKGGNKISNAESSAEDASLSMIHMIFQFFLQSGEYAFFIKRVKNIAQSKMACEGDKLRMQN